MGEKNSKPSYLPAKSQASSKISFAASKAADIGFCIYYMKTGITGIKALKVLVCLTPGILPVTIAICTVSAVAMIGGLISASLPSKNDNEQ